jgi:anaphase-promoting complex subunit 4
MLPALERMNIILSRLLGIAKFQNNDSLGLSTRQITKVVDAVACLTIVCSKILAHTVEELDIFKAFSSWMRHEIDRLASGSPVSPEDLIEKEAAIDHAKVLNYIQSALTTSKLAVFFGDLKPEETSRWNLTDNGVPMFDILDAQLKKQVNGQPYMEALPKLAFLCKQTEKQAKTVFEQIAESQKRNVFFGAPVKIGVVANDVPMRMKLFTEVCGEKSDQRSSA